MDNYTCNDIAKMIGVAAGTVRNWAALNGVSYIGEGRRKTYLWTEADIERFTKREKPGRRWNNK